MMSQIVLWLRIIGIYYPAEIIGWNIFMHQTQSSSLTRSVHSQQDFELHNLIKNKIHKPHSSKTQ